MIEAAERVLVRDGLAGVTVRAVATEAGVAPMGVYNHFGSKDRLVAAVLASGFDKLRQALGETGGGDPAQRLAAAGRSYRRFAVERPHRYRAMFGDARLGIKPTVELAESAGEAFAALVLTVDAAMLGRALRPGDPQETAALIWSAVHGAVSLELTGLAKSADPAARFDALIVTLMAGLR